MCNTITIESLNIESLFLVFVTPLWATDQVRKNLVYEIWIIASLLQSALTTLAYCHSNYSECLLAHLQARRRALHSSLRYLHSVQCHVIMSNIRCFSSQRHKLVTRILAAGKGPKSYNPPN